MKVMRRALAAALLALAAASAAHAQPNVEAATDEKRAETLVILADGNRQCSHDVTGRKEKKRARKIGVSHIVLNGKAVSKPQPEYPTQAKAARVEGWVIVQVEVDEAGNVVAAEAVSGHPLLREAAERAARAAKIRQTLLSGRPVGVRGLLTYNFVLP